MSRFVIRMMDTDNGRTYDVDEATTEKEATQKVIDWHLEEARVNGIPVNAYWAESEEDWEFRFKQRFGADA